YVLSSHIVNNPNYLFTSLHNVSNGDLVYISDNENIFTYKITKSLVVKPNETWILDDILNKSTITLYTCKYIDEFENGIQKTDRTVRFGDLIKKETSNKNLNDKLFGF
ncbi:sortase, partial [Sutterella wadsworthensis]|uniref:sortase n=1 Tax=Sutterella wadsworthensis TaxID=40545 RepID=UPI0032C1DCD4